LAHDIGVELGCGGYLHHLRRLAIGPYSVADALPQAALDNAANPSDIVDSDAWIPIDEVRLPHAEIVVNATAADRFVHGQEIVVFRSGSDAVDADDRVAVKTSDGRLIGIGEVRATLARGRTLDIQPSMVLAPDRERTRTPQD
jgi:tRNA pseudouridine55 synthase